MIKQITSVYFIAQKKITIEFFVLAKQPKHGEILKSSPLPCIDEYCIDQNFRTMTLLEQKCFNFDFSTIDHIWTSLNQFEQL